MNGSTITHKRILVLDEATQVSELEKLAAASDWPLIARLPVGIDESIELHWDIAPDVLLAYVERHVPGTRVVLVRGDDIDAVNSAADTVSEAVATVSTDSLLDELLREPAPEPVDVVRAWRSLASVYKYALEDEPLDDRLATAVERHLAHPNRQVRLRTIMVADALGGRWPKLVDLVLARKGTETELEYLVDAFVAAADQTEQ